MRCALPVVLIAAALVGCVVDLSRGAPTSTPTPTSSPFTNLVFVTVGEIGAELVPVVVADSAGDVVSVWRTDLEGNARVDVPPGGSVLILEYGPSSRRIRGFVSPPLGAVLRGTVVSGPVPTPTLTVTTLSASFTNVPPQTARITWTANCRSFETISTAGAVSPGVERCRRSENEAQHAWNVLAIAMNSSNQSLAWGLTTGIPNVSDGTTAFSVDFAHTGFGTAHFEQPLSSVSGGGLISATVNPDLSWTSFGGGPNTTQFAIAGPQGLTTAWRGNVGSFRADNGGGLWAYETWDLPEPFPSIPFALDTSLLAAPSSGGVSTADPARPVVSWSITDDPKGDVRAVYVWWSVAGSAFQHAAFWFAPPEVPPSFRFPALPSEFAEWSVANASSIDRVVIEYVDTENVDGYSDWFADPPAPLGHRSSRSDEFTP